LVSEPSLDAKEDKIGDLLMHMPRRRMAHAVIFVFTTVTALTSIRYYQRGRLKLEEKRCSEGNSA
jgi:hypothetical protein